MFQEQNVNVNTFNTHYANFRSRIAANTTIFNAVWRIYIRTPRDGLTPRRNLYGPYSGANKNPGSRRGSCRLIDGRDAYSASTASVARGRSTSSTYAIGALSPGRKPHFRMRR